MPITDYQQKELIELGDDPVKNSLKIHRNKLEKTSEKALNTLHESLQTNIATIDQTVKIYDTTRKHLNTIDGRQDTAQQNIIIMPAELVEQQREIIEAEVVEQLKENDDESK